VAADSHGLVAADSHGLVAADSHGLVAADSHGLAANNRVAGGRIPVARQVIYYFLPF
jgi:hypothetical protein